MRYSCSFSVSIYFPATLNVMQSVSRNRFCHTPVVHFMSISVYFALTVFTAEYAPLIFLPFTVL